MASAANRSSKKNQKRWQMRPNLRLLADKLEDVHNHMIFKNYFLTMVGSDFSKLAVAGKPG